MSLEEVVDPIDVQWLQETLQDYVDKTGSEVAQKLLEDWPKACVDFVKVCMAVNEH